RGRCPEVVPQHDRQDRVGHQRLHRAGERLAVLGGLGGQVVRLAGLEAAGEKVPVLVGVDAHRRLAGRGVHLLQADEALLGGPGGASTSCRRMNTFVAGRLNVSTTRPPTASWDSALALKLGLLGSPAHEPALGTLVSAPGSLAVGSSQVAPLTSLSLVSLFLA